MLTSKCLRGYILLTCTVCKKNFNHPRNAPISKGICCTQECIKKYEENENQKNISPKSPKK